MKHLSVVFLIFILMGAALAARYFILQEGCANRGGYWNNDTQDCELETNERNVPTQFLEMLTKTQSFTALSISSRKASENSWIDQIDMHGTELFFGYPIIGKLKIKQASTSSILMSALSQAIKDGETIGGGAATSYFKPHYGIEIQSQNDSYALVICFECSQIKVYKNERFLTQILTTTEPQKIIDSILASNSVKVERTKNAQSH